MKGQKRDKCEFVTKFVGIIVTIIFIEKLSSKFLVKTFPIQCFFTDHLKQKTLSKATCRAPSANTRQLYARWLNNDSTPTAIIIF